MAGGRGGIVRRDPDSSLVRTSIRDTDPWDDPRQHVDGGVAGYRADDGGTDGGTRRGGDVAGTGRYTVGSSARTGPPGSAGGDDPHAEPDERGGTGQSARHDDGPGVSGS